MPYHDHTLDGLWERERNLATKLADEVEWKYKSFPPSAFARPWRDVIEHIRKDAIGYLGLADLQQKHSDVFERLLYDSPLQGHPAQPALLETRLAAVRKHLDTMTQWCEKVLSGLSQVQSVLGEDFDNASTTKALLYLQVLERSRHGGTPSRVHAFPESHPRYSTAKKMMVSLPPCRQSHTKGAHSTVRRKNTHRGLSSPLSSS